jgi:hypothetical protein
MAVNNNGNLLDTAGEVAIDFVWGNMPKQPNDARANANRLNPALNDHIIALSGWNGFPQYTPNTAGEDVAGPTDYVLVPSVIGFTTALAEDALKDASLVVTSNTTTTGAIATITGYALTSNIATVYLTDASLGWTVGQSITISGATNTTFNGTFTITAVPAADQIRFAKTAENVAFDSDGDGSVVNNTLVGKVKTQSLSAGQNNVTPGSAVTIVSYSAS